MESIKSPFQNNKSNTHSLTSPFQNNNDKNKVVENKTSHIPPLPKSHTKRELSSNTGDSLHQSFQNSELNKNQSQSNYDLIKAEYEVIQKYNSESCFLNITSKVFPSSSNILKDSKFPIGLSISPLSSFYPSNNIPLLTYGKNDIPRCNNTKCRAYLNPFVKFIEGGEKWICNFCKEANITENYYYCGLDNDGNREDKDTKSELCNGTYEFETNESYWKKSKTPTKAFFIFMIETSYSSIQSGFLTAVIESLKDAVNNNYFYNGNDTKITIMTYDSCTSFYSFNEKSTQPQVLCVANEPVFLPTIKENLMLRVVEDKDKLISILDLIENTYSNNPPTLRDSNKIISCLNGAYLLGKNLGGKILIFSSSKSISENPKFNAQKSDDNPTKEELAYAPRDKKQLSNMGINLTNENISVDLFISSGSQELLYTMNQLADYSNGNIYYYANFKIDTDYSNLFNQIRKVLTREIAWESVLRIRFSHGYFINEFLTPVLISNKDLFVLPTLDSNQTYHVNLSLTDEKDEVAKNNLTMQDNYLYIQAGLLYSYGNGSRRIRVHNLCVPLTDSIRDIYLNGNSELVSLHFMKASIDKLYRSKNMNDSIVLLENNFKSLISSYLDNFETTKKELPDNLALLPLYMLGIFKNKLFFKDEIERRLNIDLSNYFRIKIQKMETNEAISFILPKIFPLHLCYSDPEIGTKNNETGEVLLPQMLGNSLNNLDEEGLYLIDNGFLLIIFVRKSIPSNILMHLFGVENIQFLTENPTEEAVFEKMDEIKERIVNIIDSFRGWKSLYQNLIFVFEGKDSSQTINDCFIEDNFCRWYPIDYYTFYSRSIR